jgi:hypothetical protein
MKLMDRIRLPYRAEQDAEVGIEALDFRTTEMIGQRPSFEPKTNLAHRSIAIDLGNTEEMDELRPKVIALKDELARHISPTILNLGIAGLLLVEALAGIGVFREEGFGNPDRVIFGLMLAIGIVALTWLTVRLGTREPGLRRSRWFYVVVAAYAVVILSVAFLRSSEGDSAPSLPLAVLMILLTVGAAWLIEHLIRFGKPGRELRRQLRTHENRLRVAETRFNRAKAMVEWFGWKAEHWDRNAEWIRARYLIYFRMRSAELRRVVVSSLDRTK